MGARIWVELSKPPGTEFKSGDKISIGKSIKNLPVEERLKIARAIIEMSENEMILPENKASKVRSLREKTLKNVDNLIAYAEPITELGELKLHSSQGLEEAKKLRMDAAKKEHEAMEKLEKAQEMIRALK